MIMIFGFSRFLLIRLKRRFGKRYMKGVLNDKRLMSSYGLAQGEYGLRQALCKYVYQNRNILCFPEQMVIGSNYQSLLYIFCGMLDKNKGGWFIDFGG